MRSDGVPPYEMSHFTDIDDSDIEAIRAGLVSGGDEHLGEIAQFAADLERAFPLESTEPLEGAHLTAMLDAARLAPAKAESRKAPTMKKFLASKMARIAAGSVAALLAFAGIAAAGVLPVPVQNVVADAVAPIGVNLPGGTIEADEPAEAPEVDAVEAADVEDSDEASATADDQGEDADDAAEDATEAAEEAAEDAAEAAEVAAETAEEAVDASKDAAEASEDAAEAPEDASSESD